MTIVGLLILSVVAGLSSGQRSGEVEAGLSHCPAVCDCSGLTVNCAARGLLQVPSDIPRAAQRM